MVENLKNNLRRRLDEKHAEWREKRYQNAAKLFALGVVGLVVPVIPGVLLIGGAFWLAFPKQAEKIWERVKVKRKNSPPERQV